MLITNVGLSSSEKSDEFFAFVRQRYPQNVRYVQVLKIVIFAILSHLLSLATSGVTKKSVTVTG